MSETNDPQEQKPVPPARPIARPAAAAGSTPKPASNPPAPGTARPAGAGAARPAGAPAPQARPASAAGAPKPASPVGARPAAARPAAKPAAAPAGEATQRIGASVGRASSRATGSPDVKREVEMLRARNSKTMMYVWGVCGVLAVVAVIALVRTLNIRETDRLKDEAETAMVKDFITEMKKFDITKEGPAKQAIELANASHEKWVGKSSEGEVRRILSLAQVSIATTEEKRDVTERLAAIEAQMNDLASMKLDQIKSARRNLADIVGKGKEVGEDFFKRAQAAQDKCDRCYVTKLLDDAKNLAGQGAGSLRAGLTAFTTAEQEALRAMEAAMHSGNEEIKNFYQTLYGKVVSESDAVGASYFTPEIIEKTPWKDLLSGDQAKAWKTDGLSGFKVEGGVLQAVGPAPGTTKNGIFSICDKEKLRDFTLELEFVPVKGKGNIYYRLFKLTQNVEATGFTTINNTELQPGATVQLNVSFIGSHLVIKSPSHPEATVLNRDDQAVRLSRQRFGAVGFEIADGTEIRITKMRVRELRSDATP